MGLKRVVKKGVVSGLNVSRWVGFDHLKSNGRTIKNLFSKLFKLEKQDPNLSKETFAEFMQRFNWSEQDVQKRIKNGAYLVGFCLISGFFLLAYTIYLICHFQIIASFVCLMLTCFLLANAFREHITLFRLKKRCLECTVQEWLHNILKGSK
jgi:intracellular multiplication protein IcmV